MPSNLVSLKGILQHYETPLPASTSLEPIPFTDKTLGAEGLQRLKLGGFNLVFH